MAAIEQKGRWMHRTELPLTGIADDGLPGGGAATMPQWSFLRQVATGALIGSSLATTLFVLFIVASNDRLFPIGLSEVVAENSEKTGTAWDVVLARKIFMSLSDANRTNNYSVLRGLSAPAFQAMNSPERLSEIFSGLRRSGADLTIAARGTPRWLERPRVDENYLLRMRGIYDSEDPGIEFALTFSYVEGSWRLVEIGVATRPVPAIQ